MKEKTELNNDEYLKRLIPQVVERLKNVFDPEIPVNIYDLGLIYKIGVDYNANNQLLVFITMTLTTPGCPVAETFPIMIKNEVMKIGDISDVLIDITFDPPWDQSKISEDVRFQLGLI